MSTFEQERLINGTGYPSYNGNYQPDQYVFIDESKLVYDSPNGNQNNGTGDDGHSTKSSWIDRVSEKLPYIRDRPISYKLKENINAGVTVSLINLPLSISLSLAAHGTPSQVRR